MENRLTLFALVALIFITGWNLVTPLTNQPTDDEISNHENSLREPIVIPDPVPIEPDDPGPEVIIEPECVDGECPPKVYYRRRGLFRWQKVVK